jgi:choline dehydrogenase-like flavoprotein
MMRTYLVDASRDGAEILAPCEARRIEVSNGRVQSVVARVAGGELRINTPLVALAGGSILSPALLLRSGIAASQAGRNLHLHPATVIFGVYDDMSPAWQGVPQSILSDAFAEQVGGFGFRLECPVALPGIMASALPWWGGSDHRDQMAQARQTAPFLGLVRDRGSGRVGIDRWGEPVLRYKVGALERRHLTQAIVEASRIHLAAGARRIGSLHTPPLFLEGRGLDRYRAEVERRGIEPNRLLLFSAHQMSTCRIGRHARESVANPDGQVWGVAGLFVLDASAFPTASGVNPMLTTMALASRTAERML